MRILIIEDEQHNVVMLEGLIKLLRPEWDIIDALDSVEDSVTWFNCNEHPDLIFMDIQLIDGDCFSIFDQVKIESMVIFTTAYDNYAIKAFKVNSIDYLLKPIKDKDLEEAIHKFERVNNAICRSRVDYDKVIGMIKSDNKQYKNRFMVSGKDSFFKLNTTDIAMFNSKNKITFAVTYDNKEHIIDHSLDKLEHELDPVTFYRANRHTILNIDSIDRFENYFGGKLIVKLIPPFDDTITISRLKTSAFKIWVGK
ncbi:MAG: LytTR family DNA-binding domain-containing protein [Bacteroidales bacterium]|jgi:DNA-binding LytR/AlgR family response regulator|nr:LytTR family DNA-binding domain-containing protein [Bacteroidales bacterium]